MLTANQTTNRLRGEQERLTRSDAPAQTSGNRRTANALIFPKGGAATIRAFTPVFDGRWGAPRSSRPRCCSAGDLAQLCLEEMVEAVFCKLDPGREPEAA